MKIASSVGIAVLAAVIVLGGASAATAQCATPEGLVPGVNTRYYVQPGSHITRTDGSVVPLEGSVCFAVYGLQDVNSSGYFLGFTRASATSEPALIPSPLEGGVTVYVILPKGGGNIAIQLSGEPITYFNLETGVFLFPGDPLNDSAISYTGPKESPTTIEMTGRAFHPESARGQRLVLKLSQQPPPPPETALSIIAALRARVYALAAAKALTPLNAFVLHILLASAHVAVVTGHPGAAQFALRWFQTAALALERARWLPPGEGAWLAAHAGRAVELHSQRVGSRGREAPGLERRRPGPIVPSRSPGPPGPRRPGPAGAG